MLNMFEPITLPSASCGLFLVAAMMQVINSGNEVPTATIVKDMTFSLIPHNLATATTLSRKRLPP